MKKMAILKSIINKHPLSWLHDKQKKNIYKHKNLFTFKHVEWAENLRCCRMTWGTDYYLDYFKLYILINQSQADLFQFIKNEEPL